MDVLLDALLEVFFSVRAVPNHVALLSTFKACSLIPGFLLGLTLKLIQAGGLSLQFSELPLTPPPVR
eukprot:3297183-Rhodomonas_salina.1